MALQFLLPDELPSRCPTNICLRIKFFSCRIYHRMSARTNSWHSSHSEYHVTTLEVFVDTDIRTGIPTCTRFVSLQTKRISRSSSISTREAQLSRRMHYITTNLMAKIRSR